MSVEGYRWDFSHHVVVQHALLAVHGEPALLPALQGVGPLVELPLQRCSAEGDDDVIMM